MIRAKLSPRAERDLDGIRAFIAADSPDAAARVRLTILDTADLLAANPKIGRRIRNASARHADIRWLVVPRFRNYLIFYRAFQDTIMVVRILHAAQDWTQFFPASRKPTS
jgi:plasmid stabilization system protein ParE